MKTSLQQIEDFLRLRRIAIVGMSRDEKDTSRALWKEFRARDYDIVPVNPASAELEGVRCFAHVGDVEPKVDGVLIMTAPRVAEKVMEECVAAGIRNVWLYRGMGVGAVSDKAIEYGESHGVSVIAGYCPFMFLPDTQFFHRLHGFGKRLTGSYPH